MKSGFTIFVTGYPGSSQGFVGDMIRYALKEQVSVVSGSFRAIGSNRIDDYEEDYFPERITTTDNGILIDNFKIRKHMIIHVIRDPRTIFSMRGLDDGDWGEFVGGWIEHVPYWNVRSFGKRLRTGQMVFYEKISYDDEYAIMVCKNVISALHRIGVFDFEDMASLTRLDDLVKNYKKYVSNFSFSKETFDISDEHVRGIEEKFSDLLSNLGYRKDSKGV